MNTPIKAIDLHCHFNHGSVYDTKTSKTYRCDVDFLKAERTRLNVSACALTSFAAVLSDKDVVSENEYLYGLAQEDGFLWQWVVLDPRDERTFEQARYMLKSKKTIGLKIHSPYHGYSIAEYRKKLFSFANDLGAVVLMHPDEMLETAKAADEYPEMKLILAHLGGEEWAEAIGSAKHGNVYTDTSGGASSQNNVLEYTIRQVGSEKIFFGTDSYSCAFQRGRIDYADISFRDKENVLYKNALRVFEKLAHYKYEQTSS